MIFHGLRRYGYYELAEELAYRTRVMALREDEMREFHDAELGLDPTVLMVADISPDKRPIEVLRDYLDPSLPSRFS